MTQIVNAEDEKVPAVPPMDYKGTQADWMAGLVEMGLWDGKNPEWHGDLEIKISEWFELIDKCESNV